MEPTDTTDLTTSIKIKDSTRDGLVRALRIHYGGLSIKAAFAADDTPARVYYYELKRNQPEEIAAIEEEARQLALRDTERAITAFDAEQLGVSVEIERQAAAALNESILEQMILVARGAVFDVELVGKDKEPYVKRVVPYPRDRIEAAKFVLDAARGGVTDRARYRRIMEQSGGATEKIPYTPPMPTLGVNTEFSKVSATLPDGSKVHVTIDPAIDVIEGEVEEVEAEAPTPSADA